MEEIEKPSTARTSIDRTHSTATSDSEYELKPETTIRQWPTAERALDQVALSRIETARTQHSVIVGTRSRLNEIRSIQPFGAGRPYPPQIPDKDAYLVEFDGSADPLHPLNWPVAKKFRIAATLAYVTLTASFGSSIFSVAVANIAAIYNFSFEVSILVISLYVLGFAIGPILWGPVSELVGRRIPLIVASFGFVIFSIAVASAKDAQTIFVCRFFSGFFGACPLAVVPGVFVDLFTNKQRGIAVTIYAVTVFAGPFVAPFIGGFINENPNLGWRWTEWLTAIMGALGLVLNVLFLEETFAPIILVGKAAELRRQTNNWAIHARQEEVEVDVTTLLSNNLARPLKMLFQEPILFLISLYVAFVYGMLYLFLTLYPVVFQKIHGMSQGIGGLPYFGLIIGQLFAAAWIFATAPRYNRLLAANDNVPVPEWRLYPNAVIGGVCFTIGIFFFGWTGHRADLPWILPTISGLFTGFGLLLVFLQCLNYLVDTYLAFAASAMAANTIMRSLFGAAFPLFSRYVANLGIQWAATLLGCLALIMIPVPLILYMKGAQIRKRSKYAPTFDDAVKAAQDDDDTKHEV